MAVVQVVENHRRQDDVIDATETKHMLGFWKYVGLFNSIEGLAWPRLIYIDLYSLTYFRRHAVSAKSNK